MILVVDCSVALKWVLMEDGREAALDLVGQPLIAPDFLLLECANVLSMRARRGLISDSEARTSLEAIKDRTGVILRDTRPHIPAAQSLAMELAQTAYDCLYLALANAEDATLVTADRKFGAAVARHGVYGRRIRLI